MQLEKRRLYVKELWSMSYTDRCVYSIVNRYSSLIKPELNPLKWSLVSLYFLTVTIIVCVLIPFFGIHHAYSLKTEPMPESDDPMFKDSDNWYMDGKWVVKR